ncbi:hypothetical protein F7725_005961 [Dissostichus mawsoni]|uniref:Uncharacterized protein n=1 Tax=Dissostichus mawsoni TaxID=36200 RepID=A0A7J5YT04_DISMA|nr:hypothetical protein F7725_005961 [Dissostichus mawsoni]
MLALAQSLQSAQPSSTDNSMAFTMMKRDVQLSCIETSADEMNILPEELSPWLCAVLAPVWKTPTKHTLTSPRHHPENTSHYDPDLQDPLSLSLNENYNGQNLPRHDTKKAPTSPGYDCETPDIRVIIKEEEEGWTVSENHEGFRSEGEKEETSTHSCPPDVKACGTESSVLYGVKRQQRDYSEEKCSEETGCSELYGQSSFTREEATHMLTDSEEKPRISCIQGKSDGNVTVHQGNNTEEKPFCCETNPGHKRNMKSRQRQHAGEESQEHSLHDSAERSPLKSQGLKMARRRRGGGGGGGEEEEEKKQDEEIGGLINSDGEVKTVLTGALIAEKVLKLARVSSRPSLTCKAKPREASSPTLIMEVVSVGKKGRKEKE